jgi:Fe-S-cluster containining protein
MSKYSPEILNALKQFYAALDSHIHSIEEKNKPRINCKKGCFSCCKDDLEVFGLEAEYIRTTQSDFLKENSAAPEGACTFLDDEGACRIYDSRPFVCRTHGVPIKYLQEGEEGEFELRDICPLNEEGEPIEELPNEKIFNNTSWEEKLVLMQMMADKGEMHRETLRALFQKKDF